ncbi:MAG TPA: peroxidase-related enzyme [Polyangia bacterium]|jgi:uncharacterized peroxidase-related enzyme|nr:peroxidase-related enzyme [Polyangia bacterium]
MSRFKLVQQPADPKVRALYDEILEYGFGDEVPINWFTAQATRPDILEATWNLLKAILVEGRLPPSLKQMIAMTISEHNACRYCTVVHTSALETLGVPDEVIEQSVADPELAEIPATHRAIVRFALKCASAPGTVTDADYEMLRQGGLTEEEILEVVMMAAFTNFINTWAEASGVELDRGAGPGAGE